MTKPTGENPVAGNNTSSKATFKVTIEGAAPSPTNGDDWVAAYDENDTCIGVADTWTDYSGKWIGVVFNRPGSGTTVSMKAGVGGTLYETSQTWEFPSGGTNGTDLPGWGFSDAKTVNFTAVSGGGGGGGGGTVDATKPTGENPVAGNNTSSKATFKVTIEGAAPSPTNGDDWVAAYDENDTCIGVADTWTDYSGKWIGVVFNRPGSGTTVSMKAGVGGTLYETSQTWEFPSGGTNGTDLPGWGFSDAKTVDFTAVSGGGGGGTTPAAPVATVPTNASYNVMPGGFVLTSETLADMFDGDDITYSYSATENDEPTGDVDAETSGDKVKITATEGASPGSGYVVTVTATNAGGEATKTISVTVFLPNQVPTVSTPFPNLSFGRSTSAGSYVIENVLSHFTDSDNGPSPLSISSVSVTAGTNVSVSNDNSADTITLNYGVSPATESATIKVTATDGTATVDATFTSTVSVTKGVYLWTTQDTVNNYTTIKMKTTTESIKVPGIHLKYSATSGLSFPSQDSLSPVGGGVASAYHTSGWQQFHVNSDTTKPYIVLFGDASKALGSGDHNVAYFESLFTISDIVGIADQYGNLVNEDNFALSEPPIIFEDTTRDDNDILYGDVNVSESLTTHDLTMLVKYLVNDDEEYVGESGNVKAVTYVNEKIAEYNNTFSWIDVNKNGEIDVGDACRLAEKLANGDYNIIGDRDK